MAGHAPTSLGAGRPLLRGWSHLVAFAVMVVAGPLLVAGARPDARWFVAAHAASLTALFGVSALYHRKLWAPGPRAIMRRLDHATIFVLIAGTYTGVGGLILSPGRRWLLALVWLGAAAGAAVQVAWPERRKLAAGTAIGLGWVAVLAAPLLLDALSAGRLALLLGGGVLYSAGAVAYATKRPRLAPAVFGYHEVFHLAVIGAAVAHTVVVAGLAA
ncbi:MAG TPA: hemolysin III family protein [Egibacteraceae bacterium]|nr:hemolysin III family protein [Egibacteraceae bacterium]